MKAGRICRRWTEEERGVIRSLYLNHSNTQIGKVLGRERDAVRKEMNKMKLHRPAKTQRTQPKTEKRPGFFALMRSGIRLKKKSDTDTKKVQREQQRTANEKKWASGFLSDTAHEVPKMVFSLEECRQVVIDEGFMKKTVIYVRPGRDPEEVRQSYLNRNNSIQNHKHGK